MRKTTLLSLTVLVACVVTAIFSPFITPAGAQDSLNAYRIRNVLVSGAAPTSNQTLAYNASTHRWEPTSWAGSSSVNTLGLITTYNGYTTVGMGLPVLVAKADLTAQSANVALSTLFTVAAGKSGIFRASCYPVITRAATTSSTLPNCEIDWVDNDTAVGASAWANGTSSANAPGIGPGNTTGSNGHVVMSVHDGTNISYKTASYASSGTTSMQFALHVRLEYLGQ